MIERTVTEKINVGDLIKSDYGQGKVLAVTNQWVVHDNSLEMNENEFALLISDDSFEMISQQL